MGGKYQVKNLIPIMLILLLVSTAFVGVSINVEKLSDASYEGKTLFVGGTGPGNYTNIQDAINDSTDGDTVFVFSGIYYESIIVNKSIDLIGENKNETIIDGEWGKIEDTITVLNDYVHISNFTISKNNKINSGIKINSRNVIIFNNKIYRFRYGIRIYNTSDNIIINNDLIGNSYGISLDFLCANNYIMNNSVLDNFIGIQLYSYYPYDILTNGNLITNNYISNNAQGIYIFDNHNSTINNNIIINNGYCGIRVWSSSNIVIERNSIEKNYEIGIILVYSSNVLVKENNLIKNKIQAGFLAPQTNIWEYNYWNNWRISYPKIIFGVNELPWWVTSLPIPWINFDLHPAKEPYDI